MSVIFPISYKPRLVYDRAQNRIYCIGLFVNFSVMKNYILTLKKLQVFKKSNFLCQNRESFSGKNGLKNTSSDAKEWYLIKNSVMESRKDKLQGKKCVFYLMKFWNDNSLEIYVIRVLLTKVAICNVNTMYDPIHSYRL